MRKHLQVTTWCFAFSNKTDAVFLTFILYVFNNKVEKAWPGSITVGVNPHSGTQLRYGTLAEQTQISIRTRQMLFCHQSICRSQLHKHDAVSHSLDLSWRNRTKKVGEFVPDKSWEYDKTGQRQDNYLETESGLGCPVACQSDRIYCNETVWKDRNNNSCLRRRCAGQTERRKGGGARWTQQNSQMTQTAGQTTVHKVADKTHKVTKLNQPDTRKTLPSICLSNE